MSDKRLKNKMVDDLLDGVLIAKNRRELYNLFEDLCTVAEINSLAQRFAVARMLDESFKYDDIVAKTGASTATISRVKRFLNYGANGYRLVLDRIKKQSS